MLPKPRSVSWFYISSPLTKILGAPLSMSLFYPLPNPDQLGINGSMIPLTPRFEFFSVGKMRTGQYTPSPLKMVTIHHCTQSFKNWIVLNLFYEFLAHPLGKEWKLFCSVYIALCKHDEKVGRKPKLQHSSVFSRDRSIYNGGNFYSKKSLCLACWSKTLLLHQRLPLAPGQT